MKLDQLINHSVEEVQTYYHTKDRYSVFENYGDFQVFILRRMTVGSGALGFHSEGFLMVGENVYVYDRENDLFVVMKRGYSEFVELLETYYQQNQWIINSYSGEIERLEEYLFNRNIPGYFMDLWFDIKRDLSRIENFYFRNAVVYREFMKKMERFLGADQDEYKDIEESIEFQSTNLQTMKGRIDSIQNYYESIKNDRMNKTLLTLTVVSGVFLPLNLIVGFFGMNTEGLFFTGDPNGTKNVILTMGIVLFVVLLGGKVVQLIDSYILKYILGRYNFYKNIVQQVDNLDKTLKGK